LLLAACARPIESARHSPPHVEAARETPAIAIAVARQIDVYEKPWGSPFVARALDLDVLEWREDGYVRLRAEGRVLEGYSTGLRTRPEVARGVGLFVDVETAITGDRGESIGKAHRGAFLPLVRIDGDVAIVALPPFDLTGRVPRSALTTTRFAHAERRDYARSVENRRVAIEVGQRRVVTSCDAPVGIEEKSGGAEAAQSIEGIEVIGRALSSGTPCTPRVITFGLDDRPERPIPPGWRVPKGRTSFFAMSRDLHSVVRDDGAPICASWKYDRAGRSFTFTEAFRPPLYEELQLSETRSYRAEGAMPVLDMPSSLELVFLRSVRRDAKGRVVGRLPGEGEGIALCGNPTFLVVDEQPDGLVVLRTRHSKIAAYHPDDAIVWYTRRESCERVLREQTGGPTAHVFRGC
jgi:hypothetical protein